MYFWFVHRKHVQTYSALKILLKNWASGLIPIHIPFRKSCCLISHMSTYFLRYLYHRSWTIALFLLSLIRKNPRNFCQKLYGMILWKDNFFEFWKFKTSKQTALVNQCYTSFHLKYGSYVSGQWFLGYETYEH